MILIIAYIVVCFAVVISVRCVLAEKPDMATWEQAIAYGAKVLFSVLAIGGLVGAMVWGGVALFGG